MLQALNKKEIKEQLEAIINFVETDVKNDDWYIYNTLRDELQQLKIILKLNDVI